MGTPADSTADRLCEEFWDFLTDESPQFATYAGFHHNNNRLDCFTEKKYEKRKNFCAEMLKKIDAADFKQFPLSPSMHVNVELLKYYLITCLGGTTFQNYLMPYNYWEGIDILFTSFVVAYAPLDTEQHFRDYIERLKCFPSQISESVGLLKLGIERGILPCQVSMSSVTERIDRLANSPVETSAFYKPLLRFTEVTNEESGNKYIEEVSNVIKNDIQPALRQLKDFLQETYVPLLHPWPDCIDPSRQKLMHQTMLHFYSNTNMSSEAVHALGLTQVGQLKEKILKVMTKVGFTGTIREFSNHLHQQDKFFFNSKEELLSFLRNFIDHKLKPCLSRLFKGAPDYPLILVGSPEEKTPALAIYNSPSQDGRSPARLVVDCSSHQLARFEVTTLMLHETLPGHHFQACYVLAQPALPKFRKNKDDRSYFDVPGRFPLNAAYTEGWGLYCEELGYELGLYQDPYDEFGYCGQNLKRAVRLVVDTGLHGLGWSYDQAYAYMLENTTMSPATISAEIDRYITWPAQATAYKLGHLKFKELRHLAETKLGDLFDIRKFHEICLSCGQVPLEVLEKIVLDYISSNLDKA